MTKALNPLISIYIKLLVCVFVCVSRFVRHTPDIKGKGLSCYGKGTGDVVVRVVGLLASPSPLHPSLFNLVLKSRIDPKDTISLGKGSFLTKCEH